MSLILNNPFELYTYSGPLYFCDREEEVEELISSFDNRRNCVLASSRRLGKTSLIQHLHHKLEMRKNTICIYVDVLDTLSDEDFIKKFIAAAFSAVDKVASLTEKMKATFGSLRPQFGIDPVTGTPTFNINFESKNEAINSLDGMMRLLTERPEKIHIAIDEFQQIMQYENKSVMDAAIRAHFPRAKNLCFLFSGSEEHLLTELFLSPKSPMFASTGWVRIYKIGYSKYHEFIREKFETHDKSIDDSEISKILKWTDGYTFYTQYLCNQVFNISSNKVTAEHVTRSMNYCLNTFQTTYYSTYRMLPKGQFSLLRALAKEDIVSNLYTKEFLNKHKLSASTVERAIKTLVDKQLVLKTYFEKETRFQVYDVFLKRWLQTKFN